MVVNVGGMSQEAPERNKIYEIFYGYFEHQLRQYHRYYKLTIINRQIIHNDKYILLIINYSLLCNKYMRIQKQGQYKQILFPHPIHSRPKYQPPKSSSKHRRLSFQRYSSSQQRHLKKKQLNIIQSPQYQNTDSLRTKPQNPTNHINFVSNTTIENNFNKKNRNTKKYHHSWRTNIKNMKNYFPVYTTLAGNKVNFLHVNKTPYLHNGELQKNVNKNISRELRMDKIFSQRCYNNKLIPVRKIFKIWKRQEIDECKGALSRRFLSGEKLLIRTFLNNSAMSEEQNDISYTTPVIQGNKSLASLKKNPTQVLIHCPEEQIKLSTPCDMIAISQLQNETRNQVSEMAIQIKPKKLIKSQMGIDSLVGRAIKPFTVPFERYYYFDFLWKIAYSNKLKVQFMENLPKKYKVYVGQGNNSMLIKTLFKKRQSWWTMTDKMQQANFIWTQIKVNSIYEGQKNCGMAQPNVVESTINNTNEILKTNVQVKRNIKILNSILLEKWLNFFDKNRTVQQKLPPSFSKRNRLLKTSDYQYINHLQLDRIKIHNHLQRNYVLGNKKALFSTMKKYYQVIGEDVFDYLPLTFHIQNGIQDKQYIKFLKYFTKKDRQQKQSQKNTKLHNIWIVKPGEFTNRGNGITVCRSLEQIRQILKSKKKITCGGSRTYIVQEYLAKPFLYYRRKFDIRHYMLITCVNGHTKGYWYEHGYIRTTSFQYSLKNSWSWVHLTNDAVQKQLPEYGKYEKGNKLSYEQFERYLEKEYHGKYSFFKSIYPQMKKIAYDSMRASALLIDQERKCHNFEIFGFDFMIDWNFHPWLIEINTNPCLEISCPVLMDVILGMVQNTLKIGVDAVLIPPYSFSQKRPRFSDNVLEENKFQLLYDSTMQQQELKQMYQRGQEILLNFKQLEKEQEEVYEDDGVQLDD